MRPPRTHWPMFALAVGIVLAIQSGAPARETLKSVAVLQVEIEDTTAEAGSIPWHDDALRRLTKTVNEDLAASGLYQVIRQADVDAASKAAAVGTGLHACNGCELDIARNLGADRVMVTWIFKMSLLILALHVEIKDVSTGNTVYRKTFDFKGDNEEAWRRASRYMVRNLKESQVQ